jgi:hypothetical protein
MNSKVIFVLFAFCSTGTCLTCAEKRFETDVSALKNIIYFNLKTKQDTTFIDCPECTLCVTVFGAQDTSVAKAMFGTNDGS